MSKGASALLRIRTNDALTSAGPWHLREFTLQSGTLQAATVKQTPDFATTNRTKLLGAWITQNKAAINQLHFIEGTGQVPATFPDANTPFLGAEALNVTNLGSGLDPIWQPQEPALDYTNPTDVDARHNFALGTCNGCHGFETKDPNSLSEFFAHIMPRKRANTSQLSSFLTGVPTGQPLDSTSKVHVPDPMVPSATRHFNAIAKRNQRMADLIDGRTSSTLAFQPSPTVD